MSITKFDAVVSLLADTVSVACVDATDITTFYYQNGSAPSSSAIDAEVTRLETLEIANAYKIVRKQKYDLLNQDEMRYDDTKNSTTTWVDAIDAIKVAHPKP